MNDKLTLIHELKSTHKKIISLITGLTGDELSIAYHPGVNPPIWELGHATFFYEVFILKEDSFDPSMDDIWDSFNIDHAQRWEKGIVPSRDKTLVYVDTIYKAILKRIEENKLNDADLYLYKYAIYHQNMHIESLIWARQISGYAKKIFDLSNEFSIPILNKAVVGDENIGDAIIPKGKYIIGMPADSKYFASNDFAFDNEKPCFEIQLEEFKISKLLVSNKEFKDFVKAGGYQNKTHWSFGGKKWLSNKLAEHPLYWRFEKGIWVERLFDQYKPLVDDFPVTHVSFWEVEAYCHWAGRRLPTEYEWEVAALDNSKETIAKNQRCYFPWGNIMDKTKVDMNATNMAQIPVSAYPQGDSIFGCRQMIGTVWEWTSSQYLPYDGFTMDMYVYMSTLQFGYHKTTKGGSCATSSNLIRGSYRQAYFPDRRDVYVGFRTCAL